MHDANAIQALTIVIIGFVSGYLAKVSIDYTKPEKRCHRAHCDTDHEKPKDLGPTVTPPAKPKRGRPPKTVPAKKRHR